MANLESNIRLNEQHVMLLGSRFNNYIAEYLLPPSLPSAHTNQIKICQIFLFSIKFQLFNENGHNFLKFIIKIMK